MNINTFSENFSFEIRLALIEDVFSLGKIENSASTIFDPKILPVEFQDITLSLSSLDQGVRNKCLWVACIHNLKDEIIVGYALAEKIENFGHLVQISVHSDFMQKGIGLNLLKKVASWCKETKLPELWLTTFEHVAWNAPFYKKFGFEKITSSKQPTRIKSILLKEKEQLPSSSRIAMRLMIES